MYLIDKLFADFCTREGSFYREFETCQMREGYYTSVNFRFESFTV